MKWQKRARLGIAIFGIVFAAGVYFAIGERVVVGLEAFGRCEVLVVAGGFGNAHLVHVRFDTAGEMVNGPANVPDSRSNREEAFGSQAFSKVRQKTIAASVDKHGEIAGPPNGPKSRTAATSRHSA